MEKLGTGRKYSTHFHYLSCRQFSSSLNMRTECFLARYCISLIHQLTYFFLSKKIKRGYFQKKKEKRKEKLLRLFSSSINESFRHGPNLLYVSTVQTQQSNSHKRKQLTDWLTFYCCH